LEKRRVERLIKEGKSFKESKKQSRDELLSFFSIILNNDLESENFDILKNSEEGGILLSISLLLQGNNSVGQLTQLLSQFQNDLSDNGKIDNSSIKKSLYEALLTINKKRIRDKIKERFESQNSDLQIPNFEKYLEIFESSFPTSPNFYLSENRVTCLCANSKPGDLALVNGKIMESVDNELLLKRIRDVNDKGEPKLDLSRLCTSLVTSMRDLFPFSYPVGNIQSWDVGNVTSMRNMFYSNKSFNVPIGVWDVKNVTEMTGMFQFSNFNQDISKWCVLKIPNEPQLFSNDSPLSFSNKPKWGTCPN
jgi:surface protein